MEVRIEQPPIRAQIDARFGLAGRKGLLFAWGNIIYNPDNEVVTPSLRAHEQVHGERQRGDVVGWWDKYLSDDYFLFREELLAHQAEFRHVAQNGNRYERRAALGLMAKRLSSKIYGSQISLKHAKTAIKSY